MRRVLGILVSSVLMLSLLAVPASAKPKPSTTKVDCRAGADLQVALDAASPGDTILIRGTCVGNFTASVVNLTLEGRGAHPTLSGLPGAPTLYVYSGSSVANTMTIRGLTIANGAGVWALADLNVVDSTIRDSESYGIGMFLGYLGRLTMRDSTVRDNAGDGISGYRLGQIDRSTVRGNGGFGISIGFDGSISHSVVRDNAGGGIATISSLGYGLGGTVTVTDTRITDNGGSGIYNGHPSIVRDSLIRGNHATGPGGGIYNGSRGRLTLIHSRITNNSASDGGGIYNDTQAPDAEISLIQNSVIKNNTPNDCSGC